MGYYIEVPSKYNKAEQLVKLFGAEIVSCPKRFKDIPKGKALICVVDNRAFEAAGYCYSAREMEEFRIDFGQTQRPRKWLYMDKAIAEKESGHTR